MAKSNKPIFWSLFAAGGTLAAFLAPVLVLLFLLAATLFGEYPVVAKIGGMVWVGLLSLIVSMPIVTSRVKKRLSRGQ